MMTNEAIKMGACNSVIKRLLQLYFYLVLLQNERKKYVVKIWMHACGVKTMSDMNMNKSEIKEVDQ